ncbi:MAG: hypothetical protein JKP98_10340 [Rhodobacteraceae bacterium]|nr:hypothetical protein [Paracoccaceae bacterium]
MRDRNRRDAVTKGLRRLGVSLIEAIFYLTVTASVLTLTAQILDREATRETNEAFAADLRQMIAAARLYADGRAGQVHQLLMNNDPLITDIPIAQLVDEGLLPGLFGEAGAAGWRCTTTRNIAFGRAACCAARRSPIRTIHPRSPGRCRHQRQWRDRCPLHGPQSGE